jgi:hypothetical protein
MILTADQRLQNAERRARLWKNTATIMAAVAAGNIIAVLVWRFS